MDVVSHSLIVISAIYLTSGLINLRFWWNERDRWDFLAIASTSIFAAFYAWFEISLLHIDSPAQYGEILRWSQIASWGTIVSLVSFLYLYVHAGRRWLFWAVVACRTLGTILTFIFPVNIQFREITAVGKVSFLTESLSYPIGVPNPWVFIYYIGFLLFFIFAADAMITLWRRGERRRAVVYGGGMMLLPMFIFAIAALINWGGLKLPVIVSPTILFVVAILAYELNYDLRRSARLAEDLRSTQLEADEILGQLNLSAGAAHVGIWTRGIGDKTIWASEEWHLLFGFEPSQTITYDDYLSRIHSDDRARVRKALNAAEAGGGEYETDYRILLPNGQMKWIGSHGKIEFKDGTPVRLRGASVDITKRKLAEEDAHEFSRKLMGAQEKERARLARELHDDLSQNLALLSIQLQMLGREPDASKGVKSRVNELTAHVRRISSDVHRISHELHPAKLNQLGLESALKGFCREVGETHGIKIGFEAAAVPHVVPNDIALCLYRIAQEAIQNVVKHSGASSVNVNISGVNGDLRLGITDNGCGFDPESAKHRESLGLVSMNERIRAVDGSLVVESVIGSGTQIDARIPLPSDQDLHDRKVQEDL